jgi:uncharacterized hydrophobic protein (TIGR00271 family)
MGINLKPIVRILSHYFRLTDDREDEREVIEQVSAGVVFRGTNLWILMFAILIASLGLNVNSTAVIIGAMLVSPLMGPIIGMGLGVGIGDFELLRRALRNYGVATVISVLTATLYFLISPLSEARSELLARTSPTLYDVLIAFCGGAAGVLALTTKSKGQVIPGVAIATALMPPLCTAGYGLATAQWNYFFGAFYLFFINTVFIALATFLGVKMLRFHSYANLMPELARRGKRLVTVVVVVAMIPAAVMTVDIVKKDILARNIKAFVDNELAQSGTQIIDHRAEHDTLRVVAVGRSISDAEIAAAQASMAAYKLKGLTLSVIQGADIEGVENLAASFNSRVSAANDEVLRLGAQVATLEEELTAYRSYEQLSLSLAKEAEPIFPQVTSIDVARTKDGTVAIVTLRKGSSLNAADRQKLQRWLTARTAVENLDMIVR